MLNPMIEFKPYATETVVEFEIRYKLYCSSGTLGDLLEPQFHKLFFKEYNNLNKGNFYDQIRTDTRLRNQTDSFKFKVRKTFSSSK